VWALVFGLAVRGLDYRLSVNKPLFDPAPKSESINDIYVWNKVKLTGPGGLDPAQLALYHYVFNNFASKGGPTVPFVGYWEDAFWYQAIANQRDPSWPKLMMDPPAVLEMVKSSASPHVVVLTNQGSIAYEANRAYFDSLPRSFENTAGFVAALPQG
jgi:hypothetical protein